MLGLFVLMQKEVSHNLKELIILTTLIFFLAPVFLFVYISVYNRRKKKHNDEKEQMELSFNNEINKAQHEIREQTMETIGSDLHDSVGQLLSLTALTLKAIDYGDASAVMKKVNDAIELTSLSIKEMRLLGKLLQGEQLVAMGLRDAVDQQVQWLAKTGQYQLKFLCEGLDALVSHPEKDLIFFRILQEILNNAIKHAKASDILIHLFYNAGILKLIIKDNGIGFDTNDLSAGQIGMGLKNIRKRAIMINGHTTITSSPGSGTEITVLISYP